MGHVVDCWHSLYHDSWQGLICPESFAHPAKMAPGLLRHIFAHAKAEGWLSPGSVVLDPFLGIGTTALGALLNGCAFMGCELESRFFMMAQDNLSKWMHEYRHLPTWGPWAMVALGDSRDLGRVLGRPVGMVCSSPPYATSDQNYQAGWSRIAMDKLVHQRHSSQMDATYGTTPGQIGALPAGTVEAVISSPPYAGAGEVLGGHNGIDWGKTTGTGQRLTPGRTMQPYGQTDGQLGALPAGTVEAVISSPPYSGNEKHDYRITDDGGRDRDVRRGFRQGLGCFRGSETYGQTPGQLGHMPDGDVTLAVSSPPYADGCTHTGGVDPQPQYVQGGQVRHVDYGSSAGQLASMAVSSPPFEASLAGEPRTDNSVLGQMQRGDNRTRGGTFGQSLSQTYGSTAGNLGTDQGDTFWSAARTILEQSWQVLAPGAHAIWVVKSYVRDKKLVDFPGDWRRVCEAVGFKTLHEHHAMLTENYGTELDLFGGEKEVKVKRASFFRRLAESKGSPIIDYETVYCMRKPIDEQAMRRLQNRDCRKR